MKDLTPLIESYITFDGKCALCEHHSRYSGWCFIKGQTVRNEETCEKFKKKVKE